MKQMISYSELACLSCPIFLATQNHDDIASEKIVEFYSEESRVI